MGSFRIAWASDNTRGYTTLTAKNMKAVRSKFSRNKSHGNYPKTAQIRSIYTHWKGKK